MSHDPEDARRADFLSRVKDLCGEHCDSFVFIGRCPDPDGGAVTVSTWGGEDFNAAVGLTARMAERLRQDIIKTDYPDNPDAEEDWKNA